jgi:hypothetical protein
MNQTPGIAASLLQNPPQELRELLDDPRVSSEAREAVNSVRSGTKEGSISGQGKTAAGAGDERLQVVNESQEFT